MVKGKCNKHMDDEDDSGITGRDNQHGTVLLFEKMFDGRLTSILTIIDTTARGLSGTAL